MQYIPCKHFFSLSVRPPNERTLSHHRLLNKQKVGAHIFQLNRQGAEHVHMSPTEDWVWLLVLQQTITHIDCLHREEAGSRMSYHEEEMWEQTHCNQPVYLNTGLQLLCGWSHNKYLTSSSSPKLQRSNVFSAMSSMQRRSIFETATAITKA